MDVYSRQSPRLTILIPFVFPAVTVCIVDGTRGRVSRRRRDPADTSTPSRNLHLPHRTQHDLNRADVCVWGGGGSRALPRLLGLAACLHLAARGPPTAEESQPKSLHISRPPPPSPRVASSQHLITRAASDADSVCSVLRSV